MSIANGWIIVVVIAAVWIIWRFASRRHALPCPVWLRWMVELDNPFTKTTRAHVIISHLNIQPGMYVADIGCGPGRLTIPLAKAVGPNGKVLAVDSQMGMLKRAQQRAAQEQLTNIEFAQVDATIGEFADNRYDRALLVTVLGEIPDRLSVLKKISAMLKPGGILSISEIIFDPHYQSKKTVSQLATLVGLRQREDFWNKMAYTIHFEKV